MDLNNQIIIYQTEDGHTYANNIILYSIIPPQRTSQTSR